MKKLNSKDWRIIQLLKNDGRISDAEIARELGISKSAVRWRRLELQKKGYLVISAYLRFDKLECPYAFVMVKLKGDAPRDRISSLKRELMRMEKVFAIYETLGEYDMIVGFFSDTLERLHETVEGALRGRSDIQDYTVLMGIKTLKENGMAFFDVVS